MKKWHIEQSDSEIFMGTSLLTRVEASDWKTKRVIPNPDCTAWCVWFITRQEVESEIEKLKAADDRAFKLDTRAGRQRASLRKSWQSMLDAGAPSRVTNDPTMYPSPAT